MRKQIAFTFGAHQVVLDQLTAVVIFRCQQIAQNVCIEALPYDRGRL